MKRVFVCFRVDVITPCSDIIPPFDFTRPRVIAFYFGDRGFHARLLAFLVPVVVAETDNPCFMTSSLGMFSTFVVLVSPLVIVQCRHRLLVIVYSPAREPLPFHSFSSFPSKYNILGTIIPI